VYVAPNGDIFVADGHGGDTNNRIVKFDKNGKYIKEWGKKGKGPGEFDVPHRLAMDSAGRLFVADRSNNRIQVFDQDGKYLLEWKQFGSPSGLWIDKNDMLYVADNSPDERNPPFRSGVRIGSVKDGKVTAFIDNAGTTEMPEGVAADDEGNVFAGFTANMTVNSRRLNTDRHATFARSRPCDLETIPRIDRVVSGVFPRSEGTAGWVHLPSKTLRNRKDQVSSATCQ